MVAPLAPPPAPNVPRPPAATSAGGLVLATDDGPLVVPADAETLPGFRRWTTSPGFPETGRIDFVDGTLYLDLMPERFDSHSLPKTELVRVIAGRVKEGRLGKVCIDAMRVVLPGPPAVSCEPDVVFVSNDALRSGRVTRSPAANGDDTLELVGPPDLVVEVVSPSSESKDTDRLPTAFFAGGVAEYWLVDCRGGAAGLTIHGRGADGFVAVAADADGYQPSAALGRTYRLAREIDPLGDPLFHLHEREPAQSVQPDRPAGR